MKPGYRFLLAALVVGALAAVSGPVLAGPPPSVDLTTPAISCLSSTPSSITLQVCGTGTYGAPGGFSIHMKTKADWLIDGWDATGSYTCLSLGGNCQGGASQWNLDAGECVSVVISSTTVADYAGQNICGVSSDCGIDPLTCNTEYVFRVFAHADGGQFKASEKGPEPPLSCFTAACPEGGDCTFTWGYWKTHGPVGCNPPGHANLWPVTSLTIGSLNLTDAQLCDIFQQNPKACAKGGSPNSGANTVLILEHQLIAAMLNVANGAINCSVANQAIIDANALLVGREYDCVGAGTTLGQQLIAVKDVLAAYNSDICTCPVQASKPGEAAPMDATPVTPSTWGKLKKIYR